MKLGYFGTQNRLQICGKYLNVFGEYTERIYAHMEKTHIRLIRQDIKVCISQLITTHIFKFVRFFLHVSTLYGID
jgi:hypothetical protein